MDEDLAAPKGAARLFFAGIILLSFSTFVSATDGGLKGPFVNVFVRFVKICKISVRRTLLRGS